MKTMQFVLNNEQETQQFAGHLSVVLRPPAVLTLSGEIGAGKTTLIRALLKQLGVQGSVKSPTFSLVESYFINHLPIHHFDLYRIVEETELEYIGFRDYFAKDTLCFIEWPEKAAQSLPTIDLRLTLMFKGSGRLLSVEACSDAGETMLSCLADKVS